MTREQQALEALMFIVYYARTMSPELISTYAEDAIAALSELEAQPPEPRLTVDRVMGLFDEAVDAVTEPGDDEDTQDWIDIKDVAIEFRDRLTKAAQP